MSKSKVGLSNVDNTADSAKNVLSASKLTTARNITIGSAKKSFDGTSDISFSLADIGASASGHTHNYASKVTLAGTDYSCVSNTITITKANLQTAIGSTGLGLMTEAERSKLNSIKVSSGGTIDFSGVTASGVLTATIGKDKTVALTHNTSGVKAGTYKSVTVDTYGHVTTGANPTTLSGYGITDALSSSTKYALSDSVGGNALKAISDKNGKDIDSTYLKMFTSGGLRTCTGDGKYNYFKIATIKISTPYINRPIVFELSGRGKHFSLLSIRFNSCGNYKDMNISVERARKIQKWLSLRNKKFKINAEGYEDIYWVGTFTCKQVMLNGAIIGFNLTFTANTPYALQEERVIDVDLSEVLEGDIVFSSDVYGYIDANFGISLKEKGDLKLSMYYYDPDTKQYILDRTFSMDNCIADEGIFVEGSTQIVKTTWGGHPIGKDCNFLLPRLINTYQTDTEEVRNKIVSNLKCRVIIYYNPTAMIGYGYKS